MDPEYDFWMMEEISPSLCITSIPDLMKNIRGVSKKQQQFCPSFFEMENPVR